MQRTKIVDVLKSNEFSEKFTVKGWVRAFRSNRFIILNDGSTINNLQCVVDYEKTDDAILSKINTGAALCIEGTLKESQGRGQRVEIEVKKVKVLGEANPEEIKKTIL